MLHHVASRLRTYPKDVGTIDQQMLAACIEACFECAQTCTACADACLAEDMVTELTQCIRRNQDCADDCEATGRGPVPSDGREHRPQPCSTRGVSGSVPVLRRGVREACRHARALQGLRRHLPSLRAGLRRNAGLDQLTTLRLHAEGAPTVGRGSLCAGVVACGQRKVTKVGEPQMVRSVTAPGLRPASMTVSPPA